MASILLRTAMTAPTVSTACMRNIHHSYVTQQYHVAMVWRRFFAGHRRGPSRASAAAAAAAGENRFVAPRYDSGSDEQAKRLDQASSKEKATAAMMSEGLKEKEKDDTNDVLTDDRVLSDEEIDDRLTRYYASVGGSAKDFTSFERPDRGRHVRLAESRDLAAIPYDADEVYDKLVRIVMRGGNKSGARKLVNQALYMTKQHELKLNKFKVPLDMKDYLFQCVSNVSPLVQNQRLRKGGRFYQIPSPMQPRKSQNLAMVLLTKTKHKAGMKKSKLLYFQLISSYRREGKAYQRMVEIHKQAEANRAYLHMKR